MAEDREPAESAADYDELVDWGSRLAREAPFFRAVFDEAGVASVADVGCGSGRHALLFASWGLKVFPIDPSPSMVARARENAAEAGVDLPFYEGVFGDVARIAGARVDAITCLGNALPHVEGMPGLRSALEDFAAALRPEGVLVLHLLNHQRLLDQRIRTIPAVVRDTVSGTKVFLRVLGYDEPGGISFDFLTLTRTSLGEWTTTARHSLHTAIPAAVLVDELDGAGFTRIALFGAHDRRPFDGERDESVIVLAYRR